MYTARAGPGPRPPELAANMTASTSGTAASESLSVTSACTASKLGSIIILPVHPRAETPAKRVLVRAVKEGRAPLVIRPGFALHDAGPGKYTPEADRVLRGQARLALTG